MELQRTTDTYIFDESSDSMATSTVAVSVEPHRVVSCFRPDDDSDDLTRYELVKVPVALELDAEAPGPLWMSINEARDLAALLLTAADEAENAEMTDATDET